METGQTRIVRELGSVEPVTLAEAKIYLGVTNTVRDTQITSQITTARSIIEGYLSRDVISKSVEQTWITSDGVLYLYGAPITSVDTVTVDEVVLTLGTGYSLRGAENDPVVYLTDASSFNGETVGSYQNVVVTYTTAGLTNASIKQAVLALLRCLYDGDETDAWKKILAPHRKLTL